jgi:hypothetical protein
MYFRVGAPLWDIPHGKPYDKEGSLQENYTRNEWRRCKNTLETSGEDGS